MRGRLTASQYLTVARNLCHYNLEPGSYYFMPDGRCYSRSTEGNSCLPRVVMTAFVGREQENMTRMMECVHPCSGPAGGSVMGWGRAPISLENSNPNKELSPLQ